MSDLLSLTYYSEAGDESELVNRPDKSYTVHGQAGFLAIAVALEIPVLSAQNNVLANMNPLVAGAGASFSVRASLSEMSLDPQIDFVNTSTNMVAWVKQNKEAGRFRRHVSKHIVTSADPRTDDARHLAAIINEIRVLSAEVIRESDVVVAMLGLSWQEMPSRGRFWPQIILEAADEGTLTEYLQTNKVNFDNKLAIAMGVSRGLEFLHSHGIVHCDLKPSNILIFTTGLTEEQLELCRNAGKDPIRTKLCDFGFAVITEDYPAEKMFQARVGSYPWIAPELDAEMAIPMDQLHKADIYCLGLVMAAAFMDGVRPFDGISDEDLLKSKLLDPTEPGSAASMLLAEIEKKVQIDAYQREYIEALLYGTCTPLADNRVSLPALQNYLFLGIMQCLGEGTPALRTDYFPDLRDAGDGYKNALLAFQKKHAPEPRSDLPPSEADARGLDILSNLRSLRDELYSTIIGNAELEETLAKSFVDTTLPSSQVRRFAATKTTEGDVELAEQLEEIWGKAIVKVPDFAYEQDIIPSLLPRVSRRELVNDLENQASQDAVADPLALFHLAGAYFNGQLCEPDRERGLAYLVQAASLKCPEAISTIINVYEAAETNLQPTEHEEILQAVKEYGTRVFSGAQGTLFDLGIPRRVENTVILAKTWAKKWPAEYENYLKETRRMINTGISITNNPLFLRAKPKTGVTVFDYDTLASLPEHLYDRFDLTKKTAFIEEVRAKGCLEMCDSTGFTMLQRAAINDDIALAEILVVDLGAAVDGCGNTHGWTPLLLSSHCGYFELAKWFTAHGANVSQREELHGASILHSLNRFTERAHCEGILDLALEADLDINCAMDNGLTPLHATFTGWDYSAGVAAELLVEYGGDPTRAAPSYKQGSGVVTPISLAAEALNVPLLERMIAAVEATAAWAGQSAARHLVRAKSDAARDVFAHPDFYYMASVGKDYRSKLVDVLRVIVDRDVQRTLANESIRGGDASVNACLVLACQTGRGYIVEALFSAFPQTPATMETGTQAPRQYIHIALERRGITAVRSLIRHGADLLAKGHRGQNALFIAAHYFPEALEELVEAIEQLDTEKRGGKSVKEILEEPDDTGMTVFGKLLEEGYTEERHLAEKLRAKYDLAYDFNIRSADGDWMSLPAHLIVLVAYGGLIPIDHIKYLLELRPAPRFVCGSDDQTLLCLAIQSLMGAHYSHDMPCHQLTAFILEQYPDYKNLLLGPESRNPWHVAAYWANNTAIQMMRSHIRRKYPREKEPINERASGNTPLDYATMGVRKNEIAGERSQGMALNKSLARQVRASAVECYKSLREAGALHNWELLGNTITARILCWNPDLQKAAIFIRLVTETLGLAPAEVDFDNIIEMATNAAPGARLIRVPVIELVWRYDNFMIRFYRGRLSSLGTECIDQFGTYIRDKCNDKDFRYFESLHLDVGCFPYMTLTYKHPIPDTGEIVEWKRGGRTWTRAQVDALRSQFATTWDHFFGRDEEAMFAALAGTAGG